MIRLIILSCLAVSVMALTVDGSEDPPRPNILWITTEDMSPNLGCYGDSYSTSPAIDGLAAQGVRYTQAFATSPTCSPSRSCLITGIYATSLGTQRLRSHFPIPPFVRGYGALLRDAGYFTSNNVKTDYNIAEEQAFIERNWDSRGGNAHWRQRAPGQPFFSVFNLMTTHQSRTSVWTHEQFEQEVGSTLEAHERHAPEKVPLPPYYPDTPEVRRSMARYYDCITAMDKQVAQILAELEEDGLADDTIVFFYSDHGMGMPRGKRLLHDSGMHVPLIVRLPEKLSEHAPVDAGETVDRLVSFVDFAPTVLSLAGVPIPDYMQGGAFLGPETVGTRSHVFGARDRVDEVYDLSRSIRDDRYLLIRNFMPHLGWMPPERYSDSSDMRRELRQLQRAGELNSSQLTYASPRKPVLEFYDTRNDPHQIHNLATDPAHNNRIAGMLAKLEDRMINASDLGFLTEAQMWNRVGGATPWDIRHQPDRYDLGSILAAARNVGNAPRTEDLGSPDPAVRYWAAVAANAAETTDAMLQLLDDDDKSVRIEAAAGLVRSGNADALRVLTEALEEDSPDHVLHAMRALELAGRSARPAEEQIGSVRRRAETLETRHPSWMFVRFSAEAALEELASAQ